MLFCNKEFLTYAIAQTSGKQFIFAPGLWYDVDFVRKSVIGDFLSFNKILFFRRDNQIQLGKPFLGVETRVTIPAKIIQVLKGKKITILKTKPKKKYTRTKGHRQCYTRIQIEN